MRTILWTLILVATVCAEKSYLPFGENIKRIFCSSDSVDIAQLRDSIIESGVRHLYKNVPENSLTWMLAEDSLIMVHARFSSDTVYIFQGCTFRVWVQVPDTLVHFIDFYDKYKQALRTVDRFTNWELSIDEELVMDSIYSDLTEMGGWYYADTNGVEFYLGSGAMDYLPGSYDGISEAVNNDIWPPGFVAITPRHEKPLTTLVMSTDGGFVYRRRDASLAQSYAVLDLHGRMQMRFTMKANELSYRGQLNSLRAILIIPER